MQDNRASTTEKAPAGRRALARAMLILVALLATYLVVLTYVAPPAPAQTGGTTISDDDTTITIDDRDRTNVCNQVVNIILEDVQNPDVDNNQSATATVSSTQSADSSANVATGTVTTGDSSNELEVDVSNEQIVDIAQELNVSPVIVQQCIQQLGDNNNAEQNADGDGNGSDNGNGGNGKGNSGIGANVGSQSGGGTTGVLTSTIPNKQLPNTGGSPDAWWGIGIGILTVYAGLFAWRVSRKGW